MKDVFWAVQKLQLWLLNGGLWANLSLLKGWFPASGGDIIKLKTFSEFDQLILFLHFSLKKYSIHINKKETVYKKFNKIIISFLLLSNQLISNRFEEKKSCCKLKYWRVAVSVVVLKKSILC